MSVSANLINIQHFSIHDGPGIRTTVFLKGCNLRCRWCHNPESWTSAPVLMRYPNKCIGCGACVKSCPKAADGKIGADTGTCILCRSCAETCYAGALEWMGCTKTSDEVLEELLSDKGLYESSGGGVTFSGGEPLLQPAFLADILPKLKAHGIHTAIESALCVDQSVLEALLSSLDFIMCDIKCMDSALHKAHTGADNRKILENIRFLACSGKTMILRTPVVPDFNDTEAEIGKIAAFIASLERPEKHSYELLPFSGICRDKYSALGMQYPCAHLQTPSKEQMNRLARHAEVFGLRVQIN